MSKTTDRNTVVFSRVSSRSQEDGYSLDAQQKTLLKYCKENNFKIIKEFKIAETASKNEERGTFHQMLSYIGEKKINHLVVEKTDRLTRNFRDAVIVDDWLERQEDQRLHMVKEGLVIHKHARSDAKLMWNIYLAIAKKYTDNLREETMKGWAEKLAQGWMPSPPPHGYRTMFENGRKIHVIDEETSPLIKNAFSLFLEPGESTRTIADYLKNKGLTSRKGRPLVKSAVHRILRNPFYMGVIRFDNKEYSGAHEPLISAELFNMVQDRLSSHSGRVRSKQYPLFQGLINCGTCKGLITWQLQKTYRYGSCQRVSEECKSHSFLREDRVEFKIMNHMDAIEDKDHSVFKKLKSLLDERWLRDTDKRTLRISARLLKQQIARLSRIRNNLYEDKLAGLITNDKYLHKDRELDDREEVLHSRLKTVEAIDKREPRKATRYRNSLLKLYERSTKTEKRIIMSNMFKLVAIGHDLQIERIDQ